MVPGVVSAAARTWQAGSPAEEGCCLAMLRTLSERRERPARTHEGSKSLGAVRFLPRLEQSGRDSVAPGQKVGFKKHSAIGVHVLRAIDFTLTTRPAARTLTHGPTLEANPPGSGLSNRCHLGLQIPALFRENMACPWGWRMPAGFTFKNRK